MNLRIQILEDEIVQLIPLIETDYEEMFKVASDPKIWKQHPSSDRYKPEVFRRYFDGAIEGKAAFKIVDIATNKIIGSSRYYDFKPDQKSIAIGYTFLAKEFWGGVYNQAIKKLLIDYAFLWIDTIHFHIGSTNLRSQKAILKIGASKIEESLVNTNENQLVNFDYILTKQEWNYKAINTKKH